ncbi:MAG TPA: hypothetical protein VMJ10_33940 [Kofleriaceae bacterium]|nr:hypothetical protein [Kofleriaceae bacterium]
MQPGASREIRIARLRRAGIIAAWIALAAPGIYQLVLLAIAVAGRIAYPYDLEWMEGGLLHHAQRLASGHGIYNPPSIEFIPYLYTPLYPALLALLGKVFGLTYTLGRAISVASLVGIAAVAAASIAAPRYRHLSRASAWAGVALALGLFAAIYPYVEGWYDLVRADTLYVFLVTAGLAAALAWNREGHGWRGEMRAAAAATILALAFFTKQTAILYVVLGGAIICVVNWRRIATYVGVSAAIGVGGTALGNNATDGWFWIYVSKIHRAHDFNMDRFWRSFPYILWHFPAMSIVVAVTLVVVAYTWIRRPAPGHRRELPRQVQPFLLWTAAFAVSTLVGAIGWGTEFAHFNAYIPAFLHGGLAAGAAIPALATCVGMIWGARPRPQLVAHGVAGAAAIALGVTLVHARWQPQQFIPNARDVAAGDKLVERLRSIDGDVWMPSHPWYLVLAGKTPHVHRMGVKDVTTRQTRTVAGMDEALREHRFSAIVLDDRDLNLEVPRIAQEYRPELELPDDERPHLYSGALVVPTAIWVPAVPATPPAGAHVVADFESPSWGGWVKQGAAFGDGPTSEALPGQDLVIGATGRRFATSMHGGDAATGRVTSPAFTLDGARLTLHLGGGTDATKLRAELWVDGALVRTAGVPAPGGDTLREVRWDLGDDLRGKQATLVLVDDSPTGHLDCDDVWLQSGP